MVFIECANLKLKFFIPYVTFLFQISYIGQGLRAKMDKSVYILSFKNI